jgi:hypothetical protein
MSDPNDRAMEEEARALLGSLRAPEATSAATKARAMRRMALSLPVAMEVAPPTGDTPDDDGGRGPRTSGHAPTTSGTLARALAARVPAWSLLASFAAGGALALAVTRRAPAPDEHRSPALSAAPAAAPPAPFGANEAAPPSAAPPVTAAASEPSRPHTPAPTERNPPATGDNPKSAPQGLEAERAVLDAARAALGRGDGAEALRSVDDHARRFPRGVLVEEREAMGIQALRLVHRNDEAGARLNRFRARFPASLMRPALEAAADGGAP